MQHTLHRLLKWLGYLALACYAFVAVVVVGVRGWVLPNINQWREPLQRELSSLLSVQVQLGELEAEWHGRHPRITVRDAVLRDAAGRSLLEIPSIDAVLAWHSLFTGAPRFVGLHADGVKLTVRRDSQGRISILGQEIEDTSRDDAAAEVQPDSRILHWLAQQGPVQFTNASLRWIDRERGAPPLALRDVSLGLGIQGDEHVFSLRARPPEALGRDFTFQGRVQLAMQSSGPLALENISGQFHVGVEGMRPAAWRPWLEVHSILERGEVSWRGWQQVTQGVPGRHVSLATVRDGVWRAGAHAEVRAALSLIYLAGTWSALNGLWAVDGQADASRPTERPSDVRVAMRMQGLSIDVPDVFEAPLTFDDIAISTDVARDSIAGWQLDFDRAQVRNADMDLDVKGSWQQLGGGLAGLIDVNGHFHRAELAAIVRYLPTVVGEEARRWMRHGLLAGRLTQAPVRLQGDLFHFPFGDQPEKGDFYVGGPVNGVVIDYAPAETVGPPGWPRLEHLDGHAQLHRVDLKVRAERMQMRPGGQRIELRGVHAHIQNIEENSVLRVTGTGRAPAEAILSLVRTSPLARLLDGLFDEAEGTGNWEVPIALTIPLLDTDETEVEGAVNFENAGLRLSDGIPALSGLNGRVAFTESFLTAHDVKGQGLGGPVTVTGGVGEGRKGLVFDGRLTASALAEYVGGDLNVKDMLGGSTSYRLALQRNAAGSYSLRFDSSLEGLKIGLPEPLGKPEKARRPLRVQWTPATGKADAVLDVRLANQIVARFLHRKTNAGAAFFHSGVIRSADQGGPVNRGLKVDLTVPQLDIDAWRAVAERQASDALAPEGRLLPPLQDLRLQAERARVFGTDLEHLTFTARRPEGDRWRVDISSTETAGTLYWRERNGQIQGEVEANFERLALGEAGALSDRIGKGVGPDSTAEPLLGSDDEVRIPALRLKVNRLRLYGRDVGAVSLVGVNQSQGRVWRLDHLNLTSPHGALQGNGVWRLTGARRGLTLHAEAVFDDLGAWLAQAGFKDLMQGGQGKVKGDFEWRGIPWRFDLPNLQGELSIDLAKGRMSTLGSRSARLLELLSLQSVKRLATLEWNPAGLIQQGFPFDTIQGQVKVTDGIMHSENYRIAGPVGTVVIAGDVDLPKERLDLYAVVVPSFDVSGAAIAAGIAVNPIVGVGAFLTQWLLKDPLGKAMAVEYRVKGSFDEPQINVVPPSTDSSGGVANRESADR